MIRVGLRFYYVTSLYIYQMIDPMVAEGLFLLSEKPS